MKEKYTPGQDCQCHAYSESECGCDVDWTSREVYELREQRDRLAEALLWAKKEHDARIAVFAYAGPVISAEYERLGMRLMEAKHNATIARESALAIVKETKKQQKKTTH
jgi:hypothetical protein